MNKKIIIIIVVVVVVAAAALGAYFIFSASNYALYSKAFDNTFKVDSMELNTSVNAVLDDGTGVASTGNFKLRGVNANTQFVNTMNIGGQTITQFSDGRFIYTDDGNNKNKTPMGDAPEAKQQERESTDFSFEAYISEFSGLLDASKIKQLNALDAVEEKYVDKIETQDVSGGKKFVVTLLPQAVDELVDNFLNENLSNKSMSPTIELISVTYAATVKSDYVTEVLLKIDVNVTAPGEQTTKKATVEFYIRPVNPGQSVSFDIPDTAGY